MENEFPPPSKMPPRSNEARAPQPEPEVREKVEKVISGQAIEKKPGLFKQFTKTFSGADNKSVGQWVFSDILVPSIKNLIYETFKTGLEMKLFGQARSPRMGGGLGSQVAYTAYNRMSAPMMGQQPMMSSPMMNNQMQQMQGPGQLSPQARQMHDFKEIIMPSRQDAVVVLEKLYELLSKFNVVSVSDFYAACGITPEFTDERWGWYNLQGSDIGHTSQGWVVDLPHPTVIV